MPRDRVMSKHLHQIYGVVVAWVMASESRLLFFPSFFWYIFGLSNYGGDRSFSEEFILSIFLKEGFSWSSCGLICSSAKCSLLRISVWICANDAWL